MMTEDEEHPITFDVDLGGLKTPVVLFSTYRELFVKCRNLQTLYVQEKEGRKELLNAPKTWRCFHCGEEFTSERWAREHFGASEGAEPACKIVNHSDGHLIAELRKLQAELDTYRIEDNNLARAWHSMQAEKVEAARNAENLGYERGVRDMKAQGFCIEPGKHS